MHRVIGHCWVLFWKNPKDGCGKLGLIAVFSKREQAEHFLYESGIFTPDEWEKVGMESTPFRN